jgi:hypothetical protein
VSYGRFGARLRKQTVELATALSHSPLPHHHTTPVAPACCISTAAAAAAAAPTAVVTARFREQNFRAGSCGKRVVEPCPGGVRAVKERKPPSSTHTPPHGVYTYTRRSLTLSS